MAASPGWHEQLMVHPSAPFPRRDPYTYAIEISARGGLSKATSENNAKSTAREFKKRFKKRKKRL
jgi:hypothetical protein